MQAVGKQKDANFQLGWKAALDAFNGRNLTRDLANIFKSVTQEARVSATLPLAQMN
jgi:hypothetical protein